MKAFTTLAVIIATASAAVINKRDVQIQICREQTFGGCQFFNLPPGQCTNLPGDMNDKISSVDTKGNTCNFYKNGGCGGDTWGPITGERPTVPSGFNDEISSVQC